MPLARVFADPVSRAMILADAGLELRAGDERVAMSFLLSRISIGMRGLLAAGMVLSCLFSNVGLAQEIPTLQEILAPAEAAFDERYVPERMQEALAQYERALASLESSAPRNDVPPS